MLQPNTDLRGNTREPAGTATIAVVLKGYPRLSETFIAQEIRALELSGAKLVLISLRHPTDKDTHPIHAEIDAPVSYLPEYLHQEVRRVIRGLARASRQPGFWRAFKLFLRDLARDRTVNRIRRFGQAVVLTAELPGGIEHLYAHFLHTPSSVARYTAVMRQISWSFSAHARDIWTIEDWEKREKLADASWGTTCTAYGHNHLSALAPPENRANILLTYHGLDLARFPKPPQRRAQPDGSDPKDPVIIVSVGRAVAKKGYDTLLEALARIPKTVNWRFVHVGGGPLARDLMHKAAHLGLDGRIEWAGAKPQSVVIEALRNGHIFALACRIDEFGDRDGLPNVLMEASSQKLACVSTEISAIPEFITHEKTGLLTAPDDAEEFKQALVRLIENPDLRRRLANAGFKRLVSDFSSDRSLSNISDRLKQAKST